MKSYFGATNPVKSFQTRMRWLIGFLGVVVLVLTGTVLSLVWTIQDYRNVETVGGANAIAKMLSDVPSVDVVFAGMRIEEGLEIEEGMLTVQSVHPDRIPEGSVLASDKYELIGKFATILLRPKLPINREDISSERPITPVNIPPGYRATTIMVDSRTGVEGLAKPKSRVDIHWLYGKGDEAELYNIASYVKVLSVAGVSSSTGERIPISNGALVPVTLVVEPHVAKKIELARNLGSLSLALIGNVEDIATKDDTPITIADLTKKRPVTAEDPSWTGTSCFTDKATGKLMGWGFKEGRWQRTGECLSLELKQ